MSKKPVLVVMAAGMGSRYGGLKQIDPVGNHGQLIIDYSIYDAKRAGFEMTGQPYARRRSTEDTPALLRPLYDCRNISFTRMESADFVADSDLPQTLMRGFKALAPMYEILMLAVEMNVQGDDGRG